MFVVVNKLYLHAISVWKGWAVIVAGCCSAKSKKPIYWLALAVFFGILRKAKNIGNVKRKRGDIYDSMLKMSW